MMLNMSNDQVVSGGMDIMSPKIMAGTGLAKSGNQSKFI
jgi:hypothetical protein